MGFSGGSDSKESSYNAGDLSSIPGSGGSPGEGNGNPLWYSCLENPMNRGAWGATWGCKESDTTKQQSIQVSSYENVFNIIIHDGIKPQALLKSQ